MGVRCMMSMRLGGGRVEQDRSCIEVRCVMRCMVGKCVLRCMVGCEMGDEVHGGVG